MVGNSFSADSDNCCNRFFDVNSAKGMILPLLVFVTASLIGIFWFRRFGEERLTTYENGDEPKIEKYRSSDTRGWVIFLVIAVAFIVYQLTQIF